MTTPPSNRPDATIAPYDIDRELRRGQYDHPIFSYHFHTAVPAEFRACVGRWGPESKRLQSAFRKMLADDHSWDTLLSEFEGKGPINDLTSGGGGITQAGTNNTRQYQRDLRGLHLTHLRVGETLHAIHYARLDYCLFEKCDFFTSPEQAIRLPSTTTPFFENTIRHAKFSQCTFKDVNLWSGTYDYVVFYDCTFENVIIGLNRDTQPCGHLLFQNCSFRKVNFERVEMSTACFFGDCRFDDIATSDRTMPTGYEPIGQSIVDRCRAWDVETKDRRWRVKGVTFVGDKDPEPIEFTADELRSRPAPPPMGTVNCYEGLRAFYRALYLREESGGSHDDFLRFQYLQMFLRDEIALLHRPGLRRFRIYFARYVFGYGARPVAPLRAWLCSNLLFSTAFLFLGIQARGEIIRRGFHLQLSEFLPTLHDWFLCLYFSIITTTTVGFGDVQPGSAAAMAVCAIEAVTGVVLMTMFTVVLARRFFR